MSLILASCRARGSAIAVRRILVISPKSSLHARKAVLVFARAKICGHISHRESHRLLPHSFSVTEKSTEHLSGGQPFPFSGTILSMGRCDLVRDEFWPCGDPDSL